MLKKVYSEPIIILIHFNFFSGSVLEFYKIIPLLTTPQPDRDFVFEVIAPSIPGYGWSSAPAKSGFNGAQCSRIFRRLMTERLGFKTFYTCLLYTSPSPRDS